MFSGENSQCVVALSRGEHFLLYIFRSPQIAKHKLSGTLDLSKTKSLKLLKNNIMEKFFLTSAPRVNPEIPSSQSSQRK